MDFRLLGALEVEDRGRLLRFRGTKEPAVLASLLLHANEVVSRERLADELWRGRPPPSAVHSLEAYVSRLRKTLGPAGVGIESHPDGYRLGVDPEQLDAHRFEQLVAEGWQALAEGDAAAADARLGEALSLWRGSPLRELEGEPAAELESERLDELRLSALEGQVDAQLALGRHNELVGRLQSLVAGHPLREGLHRRLMLALYRSGRQAEALDVYQQVRRRLVEELGLEPGSELQRLQQAILNQDPALGLPAEQEAPPDGPALPPPPPAPREERKDVTVLFCDLIAPAGTPDPEDVDALVSRHQAQARSEVERFGGTMEALAAGGVVGFFGAPRTHEDDPERAVRAALQIRDRMRESDDDLHVRIAVSTGEALVRLGTDPAGGVDDVAGDAVNTAARLHAAAPLDGVLVTETTRRATRAAIDYREAGPVAVEGAPEPLPVWEARVAHAQPTVEALSRAPFVGRRDELDLLVAAFHRARREREPQLVTVVGVPGIGKSRLVAELAAALDAEPELIRWRRGRSFPYGESVSLGALRELVKAELGVLDSDGADETEARLARSLGHLVADAAERDRIAAQLRLLLGLPGDDVDPSLSPAAFRRWIELLAGRGPLVLVFEDLQWAGDELVDFVDRLVDWPAGAPVLVVCTARPELLERRPGWGGGKRNALTISLGPLDDADTARVLAAALDETPLPDEVRAELLRRAGGNPLYAEQFARMVAEGAEPGVLPATVRGLVAARLDLLPGGEKVLLQEASVLGRVFWPAAIGADEESLQTLVRKEFVRRGRHRDSEAEYSFAHELLRDVAYAQMPRAVRAERHRHAAEWLAALPPGRAAARAELVANHYAAALELGRSSGLDVTALVEPAREAFGKAAQRALSLNAMTAAERFYTAALELSPTSSPVRSELLLGRAEARLLVGGDAVGDAEAALALLPAESQTAVGAELVLARASWLRGDGEMVALHADRALTRAATLPPSPLTAHVLTDRARFALLAGDAERAIELSTEGLALAERLGLARQRASALITRGTARRDQAWSDDLLRGVELAEVTGDVDQLMRGLNNLAEHTFWLDGDPERARAIYRRLRAVACRYDLHGQLAAIDSQEGLLELRTGAWDRALEHANAVLGYATASGRSHATDLACHILACIRHARDEPGGREAGEAGVEHARRLGDVPRLVMALAWQIRLLALDGEVEAARRLLGEMIDVYAPLSTAPCAWSPEVVWAFAAVGEPGEHVALLDRERDVSSAWLGAARAVCAGDFVHAAEIYAGIGARNAEAEARVHAGRALLESGDRTGAAAQLDRATAFYRTVRAARLIREAERIVAAPV